MGAINFSRAELLGATSETVGYKTGLALTQPRIVEYAGDEFEEYLEGDYELWVRIRAEEYQSLISRILFRVGNIPAPDPLPPGLELARKFRRSRKKLAMLERGMELLGQWMEDGIESAERGGSRVLDPTPLVQALETEFGVEGAFLALRLLDDLALYQQASPWGTFRSVEWRDTAELEDLFRSESLETQYGTFFDQRFVDFLSANFDLLGVINWRKFEALTCEYFEREGYYVEIGEGRDDGNIDARIWDKEADRAKPPSILVQCKRQKRKVGKLVVKALWADVVAEGAKTGLIVTTTSLSPGAEAVRRARGYPIATADGRTLRGWLQEMRTPFAGVFLSE